ncbi:unnamed protein product [Urochloa decumbens]|uniref:F-box domain-containing protein n=1 Tax=Urochloa decumbens TaxID=240449 RepID=A0ABC9F1B4_9POAL
MTTIPGRPRKRHRITPPPAIPTIPDDLLVSEIVARLPAAYLLRIRSVCRSWRAAVKDPAFIRRHLELSRARPPAILAISLPAAGDDDPEEEKEATAATPSPARAVVTVRAAHCDGLLAVTASTGVTAHTTVWNPAIMEFVAVPTASPNAGAGHFAMVTSVVTAIGFDSSTNGYVLSRFFYRVTRVFRDETRADTLVVEHDGVGHEVLRLGSGGWRLTEDAPFSIDDTVPPVSCARGGGAIYWAAMDPSSGDAGGEDDDDCDGDANVLLRFSLRDETFAVFPLPPGAGCVGRRDRVAELGGELCLARAAAPTAFDVWVAASAGRMEWSLRWHVDFYRPVGFVAPLAVDAGGVLLMSVDDEDVYRYDKQNRVLEKVADVQEVSRHVRWNWNGSRGEDDVVSSSCSTDAVQLLVPCVESLVSICSCSVTRARRDEATQHVSCVSPSVVNFS